MAQFVKEGEKFKIISEGKADILFPIAEDVFYNPVQEFNRDMSIAAIKTWAKLNAKEEETRKKKLITPFTGKYKILEALSASGLRSIRYAKEMTSIVETILANDLSEEAVESIKRNAEHNQVQHLVMPHQGDACDVMYRNREPSKRFHVVDLDPYGTAAPFIDGAVQSVADGGLLCVTCTDLAVLCGKYPETCHVKYGGTAINSEYCHEMALRLVIHSIQLSATRYKRKITPLMSCSIDFYVRVFIRVDTSAEAIRTAASNTCLVSQCSKCPNYSTSNFGRRSLSEKGNIKYHLGQVSSDSSKCSECGSTMHIGGPMWSGPLHNKEFVSEFVENVKQESGCYGTHDRMLGMSSVISEEIDSLLYYNLGDCAKTIRSNTPPLVKITSALLNAGYKTSTTHCSTNAIKTDAPSSFWWDIMRAWAKETNVIIEKLSETSAAKAILSKPLVSSNVDFNLHPLANPPSRKIKLVRFQDNKGQNWGPKARAKKRKNPSDDVSDAALILNEEKVEK